MEENSRVLIRRTGYPDTMGVIRDVLKDWDLYIVELDDKSLIKCTENQLEPVLEKRPEITISLEEFEKASIKVTSPLTYDTDPKTATIISEVALLVCIKLKEELFGERKYD